MRMLNLRSATRFACELRPEALFERILEIADDSRGDWVEATDGWRVNHENIQRARLRIDAIKWQLSKMYPRKYGDRITQEFSGTNGAPLIPILNLTVAPSGCAD